MTRESERERERERETKSNCRSMIGSLRENWSEYKEREREGERQYFDKTQLVSIHNCSIIQLSLSNSHSFRTHPHYTPYRTETKRKNTLTNVFAPPINLSVCIFLSLSLFFFFFFCFIFQLSHDKDEKVWNEQMKEKQLEKLRRKKEGERKKKKFVRNWIFWAYCQ